ncbi:MAG: hydroxymethylglutaryl-CoA lyase [Maricaulis sp.]|uniref:hydroxymethylglutaryl-CoA lyase n=1 Tax=Maricaulis sp. TaxID=1486257 RepID=UPI001B135DB7|nr:hydroxymethylglutaryl-CoA lyase [Maricaulis sp.]MBO6728782.1 hydroxymethylglutaryl-CoA lyase [Maricaulis sp.]MBO6848123.1 hydroxymethylglutaryl-CoA lyase [Maricaulis sp.]MBO6877803.1 hydroxymethylglutaryl-CoA lyase [Maricaulis sp.]
MTRKIEIVEVGPRDGLQNDPVLMPTDVKIEFVERLIDAGVKRMEAASFVHPKLVPAMADSAEVMQRVPRVDGVKYIGLALNEKGMRRALDSRCDEVNYVMVASPGFGLKNQNATPQQTADLFDQIAVLAHDDGVPVSVTVSVAFGDPFDGEVDPKTLGELAGRAKAAGAVEFALGDTIGVADPWAVRRALDIVKAQSGDMRIRMHFHNTRNTAMANIYAAIEAGVDVIDASVGGIGGCPFAPAATGNVATEDVVYMLDRAGIETGLDLDKLIETAKWLETDGLKHPVESALSKAGGFAQV